MQIFETEARRRARYMRIGSRIGLVLAAITELIYLVVSGLFVAIFAMLEIPLIGEAADCLGLLLALALAVIGFYLGMLTGLIIWSLTKPK